MNLYDLEVGDEFVYRHEVYRLLSHGNEGTCQAERIAIITPVNTIVTVGRLLSQNFNGYAEVVRYESNR